MDLFYLISLIPQTFYCEQWNTFNGLELFNTFSNVLFICFACLIFMRLKKLGKLKSSLVALPILMGFIGVGSFLYHAFRHPLTYSLDFIPIYILILVAFYMATYKLVDSKVKALLGLLNFGLAHLILKVLFSNVLNGSLNHILNILVIMLFIYLFSKITSWKLYLSLIVAVLIYLIAATFRTIDPLVCQQIPYGTHFLWHVFAAVSNYLICVFLIELYNLE